METTRLAYASFWQRLGAIVIDVLIFAPVAALSFVLYRSRLWHIVWPPIGVALAAGYNVYFHARWGQTLGKMATGIRVVALDGAPIGLSHAVIRYAVEFVLGALSTIATLIAVASIPAASFTSSDFLELSRRISDAGPRSLRWTQWATEVWVFGEAVVMLTNRQRRAIHDFMAGTIVVSVRRASS